MSTAARRGLLLAAAATPLTTARPRASATDIRFRILREGRQIGTHAVGVATEGAETRALTQVDIAVRIAGIVVFRLTHRFEEAWQAERLVRARSRHDRNGRVVEYAAAAAPDGLRITGLDRPGLLPAIAAPLSWWDHRRFDRPLFANDTARPLTLRWTRTPDGDGFRYACEGDENGEATYAADGTWIAWRTRAEDGSIVTYARA